MTARTMVPEVAQPAALQKLDPRAKVLCALALVLTVSALPVGSWWRYSLLYLLLVVVVRWSGLSLRWLWRRSLVALPFLLAAASLPFILPGPELISIPLLGWTISQPGMIEGGSLLLRAWIAIQIFLLLSALTPVQDLFWAMETLGIPALLVSIIAFTYRYLFVMVAEAQRMFTARQARQTLKGYQPPLRRRISAAGGFVGSLLLRGLDRSERVYAAMIARGYDGSVRRVQRFRWKRQDSLSILLIAIMSASLLAAGLIGG